MLSLAVEQAIKLGYAVDVIGIRAALVPRLHEVSAASVCIIMLLDLIEQLLVLIVVERARDRLGHI